MGPTFRDTATMAANATVRPLQDEAWIYRVLPFAAIVLISLVADATGLVFTFSAGSDIQAGPDQPVQSGGTAGVFEQDIQLFDSYLGAPGDELQLVIRETAGVATTDYNLVVKLQPL